jgi:uncharacterized protein
MSDPVIDIHIHFGAPEGPGHGCYWSEEFRKSPAFFAMLLVTRHLFRKIDYGTVKKHMFRTLDDSRYTDKAVFLALDEVYDEAGQVRKDATHLHVPNDCVIRLAQENGKVLFGASVHPNRLDWSAELDRCLQNGAVLCKWMPSSQIINPANPHYRPFYEKLAAHKLPLLCHVGPEYSVPTSAESYNEYNNPKYLAAALELGVTVVLAHCGTPYFGALDADYQDDFEEFLKLFDRAAVHGWDLHADLSALCTPFRSPYIERIKAGVPASRLIYGSDYPIPISEFSYRKDKNILSWLGVLLKTMFMKNPLDKNYLLIKEMGFEEAIFTNAARLFAGIVRP